MHNVKSEFFQLFHKKKLISNENKKKSNNILPIVVDSNEVIDVHEKNSTITKNINNGKKNAQWELSIIPASLRLLGVRPECTKKKLCLHTILQFMQLLGLMLSILFDITWSEAIDDIYVITAPIVVFTDLFLFKMNSYNVKIILDYVEKNWIDFDELTYFKGIMKKNGVLVRIITKYVYLMIFASWIVYCTHQIIIHYAFSGTIPLEVPVKYWIPFDNNSSLVFIVKYVFQCIVGISVAITFCAIDAFFICIICHICTQLEILSKIVNHYDGVIRHPKLPDDVNWKEVEKGCNCLHCIVSYHLDITRMISLFDESFNKSMLARVVICTIHIFCIGYTVMEFRTQGQSTILYLHVIYIVTMDLNLLIYCWLGDILSEKSDKIANMALNSLIHENGKICQEIVMLIQHTQLRPSHITAGNLFNLSLKFFKEHISKSSSYLSILIFIKLREVTVASSSYQSISY